MKGLTQVASNSTKQLDENQSKNSSKNEEENNVGSPDDTFHPEESDRELCYSLVPEQVRLGFVLGNSLKVNFGILEYLGQ